MKPKRIPKLGEILEEISSGELVIIRNDNIKRIIKEWWEYRFIKK